MATNLTPEYVRFVNEGGSIGHVVQEIIDRMQYSPGFMEHLDSVLNGYESPFEVVDAGKKVFDNATERWVGENEQIRRLKARYCKHSKTEADGSQSP